MSSSLGRRMAKRKTGMEPFCDGQEKLSYDVLSFWQWSMSDLLSNITRGILAEYLVARALGIGAESVRDEWAAFDLLTPDGIKVEVKSAAYLQSWHQTRLSAISFLTPRTRGWDPDTNVQSDVPLRQADVYVFALLAHRDKATVNPTDVAQWQFYVLPTRVLDQRTRSQHAITLPTLERLAGEAMSYSQLAEAVRTAAARNREAAQPTPTSD